VKQFLVKEFFTQVKTFYFVKLLQVEES